METVGKAQGSGLKQRRQGRRGGPGRKPTESRQPHHGGPLLRPPIWSQM